MYVPCIVELYSIVLRQYINIFAICFFQNVRRNRSSEQLPLALPLFGSLGEVFSPLKGTAWSGEREKVRCACCICMCIINNQFYKNAVFVNIIASLDHRKMSYKLSIDKIEFAFMYLNLCVNRNSNTTYNAQEV